MIGLETLLGAAIGAGLGLIGEAGFGEKLRSIKERLTKKGEKARVKAFKQALKHASNTAGLKDVDTLLNHEPFREALVAGLLDPIEGFDIHSASEILKAEFPTRATALRRFFNALEERLISDKTWGPLLNRYRELRFRADVMEKLQERNMEIPATELVLALNANLDGSGAGAAAVGKRGVFIKGGMNSGFIVTGDDNTINLYNNGDPVDRRRRYLAELAATTDNLPWASVDPEFADPARGESPGLSDIYTALDTTELQRVESEDQVRDYLGRQAKMTRVSAQEMINMHKKLVLLGDPGSGKTTLVNFLSYIMANAGKDHDPGKWLVRLRQTGPWDHGVPLPVRIILRDFAAELERSGLAAGENPLLAHLQNVYQASGSADFWPDFHDGLLDPDTSYMILLDGLDEAPASSRAAVTRAIDIFAQKYSQHRYLVTCRIYAYVGWSHQLSGFKRATLTPFSAEQIKNFISAWYRDLSARGRFSKKEAGERAEKLKRAATRPDLIGLAERPLLMTVMALLHTFRGQLPDDRVELYQWTVDLLLRRWESRVGGEDSLLNILDIPGLKMSDLEAGLYAVAFHVHSGDDLVQGAADIREETLRRQLAPFLENDWNKAGRFVEYVRERAGLLIRHKPEAYTFPHRTFQEFMAACHLAGMKDYPSTAARITREDPDRWRIVFILAAGWTARTHRPGDSISSVNFLCPSDISEEEQPDANAFRLAKIAAEALLEIGLVGVRREELGKVILARMKKWLLAAMTADNTLVPRERVDAGNILARLGDPRFNPDFWHLPDDHSFGFIKIPGGTFMMGSDRKKDKYAEDREFPLHEVELSEYWIARYPVTVAQFRAFIDDRGYNAEGAWDNGLDNHPVGNVSWYDAVEYCKWLSEKVKDQDFMIRLPTEAEWEKAARGSDVRIYPWGDEIDPNKANYMDAGIGSSSAVGCFPGDSGPYGTKDMSGNVWEWCHDWHGGYSSEKTINQSGPETGSYRVVRGGGWIFGAGGCRAAYRNRSDPGDRGGGLGFRLVRSI